MHAPWARPTSASDLRALATGAAIATREGVEDDSRGAKDDQPAAEQAERGQPLSGAEQQAGGEQRRGVGGGARRAPAGWAIARVHSPYPAANIATPIPRPSATAHMGDHGAS